MNRTEHLDRLRPKCLYDPNRPVGSTVTLVMFWDVTVYSIVCDY